VCILKLFGSSGIRGLANKVIGPELALNVGMAVGTVADSVVIGKDPRIAADMIEQALIAGLSATDCEVTVGGLMSTPTLAFATADYDCGIMITASHNPAEDVGIKLWNPDGMAFDSQQQKRIEHIIENDEYATVAWNEVGDVKYEEGFVKRHCNAILSRMQPSHKRVVVDCGCGAGSTITPYLLRQLGCEVITLNCQTDGYFPARSPEPAEKNLGQLIKAVRAFEADIGIAHDGDADRMMIVDEQGNFVSGDELLALFALQEKQDKVVVPVDTSMIVDDALGNTEVLRCRVGDVYVAEQIKASGAYFGGEPSGSWIFPDVSYCPDGIYAAARIVNLIEDSSLSKMVVNLPHYTTLRDTIECAEDRKEAAMQRIKQSLEIMGNVTTIDGIRVDTETGWVLVRPSGTEPKIRITAEAREDVDELVDKVMCIARGAIQ
jgi:phosphoglucosamine mutase